MLDFQEIKELTAFKTPPKCIRLAMEALPAAGVQVSATGFFVLGPGTLITETPFSHFLGEPGDSHCFPKKPFLHEG